MADYLDLAERFKDVSLEEVTTSLYKAKMIEVIGNTISKKSSYKQSLKDAGVSRKIASAVTGVSSPYFNMIKQNDAYRPKKTSSNPHKNMKLVRDSDGSSRWVTRDMFNHLLETNKISVPDNTRPSSKKTKKISAGAIVNSPMCNIAQPSGESHRADDAHRSSGNLSAMMINERLRTKD